MCTLKKKLTDFLDNYRYEWTFLKEYDIKNIMEYDKDIDQLQKTAIPGWLEMSKKPDFKFVEEKLGVKLHEDIKEFFSIWWGGTIDALSHKVVEDKLSTKKMYFEFLKSPSAIENIINECVEFNDDIFITIGGKEEGWKIVVNNNDGSVHLLEHDPPILNKMSASISEFIEESMSTVINYYDIEYRYF